jgi:hypothetical protein
LSKSAWFHVNALRHVQQLHLRRNDRDPRVERDRQLVARSADPIIASEHPLIVVDRLEEDVELVRFSSGLDWNAGASIVWDRSHGRHEVDGGLTHDRFHSSESAS